MSWRQGAAHFFTRIDWLAVTIYVVAHYLYIRLLKTPFNAMPVYYFQQYLDTKLLREDLWTSLLYLHSQPPLMNLILGLLLQGASNFDLAISRFYFLAGLATVCFFSAGMAELGIRRWLRLAAVAWLCLFPTFTLFGRWAYTTHLELALCSAIFYALTRLQNAPRITFGSVMVLGIPFCLLGLLRAQWHPAIFVVWMGLVWWLRRRDVKMAGCAAGTALAISPLLLLFLKNFVLFGVLGASSWSGMNLSGPAANSINTEQLRYLKDTHRVGRDFPVYFRHFRAELAYRQWEREGRALPVSEHPAMKAKKSDGNNNYNYQAYIEGGKQDMNDSMAIIRNYPWQYAAHVLGKIWHITAVPSISYKCCGFSLLSVRAWGVSYAALPGTLHFALRLGSRILYAVIPLAVLVMSLRRNYIAERRFFILSGLFIVMVSYVLSCVTSNLEQERMRWATEIFYLAYAAMLAEWLLRRKEKKAD